MSGSFGGLLPFRSKRHHDRVAQWMGLQRRLPQRPLESLQVFRKQLTWGSWSGVLMICNGVVLLALVASTPATVLGVAALVVGGLVMWLTRSQRAAVDRELARRT
jgi:predicted cobalt transporter CbtA